LAQSDPSPFPKLRSIDTTPVIRGGKHLILLRDPLRLVEQQIIIPQEIAPLLALCDGTRDSRAMSAALAVRYGQNVSADEIEGLLSALDNTLLLENERFHQAKEQALSEYRQAPFRKPILAGVSYPSDRDALKDALQCYQEEHEIILQEVSCRGLLSPHIDYERGGPVYAKVWGQAMRSIQETELTILLGTDHFGEGSLLSLTRQNYSTPYGLLPTAVDVVDQLAQAIGKAGAFAGELYHRAEHSIELAAVWLHHIREGRPCEILPILCGSLNRYINTEGGPQAELTLQRFIQSLRAIIADRQAIVVAAGDLSHVGPAFGGHPLDFVGRARLQASDQDLIERILAGDSQGFFDAIRRVEDRNNVCGVAPIYLTLQLLSPVRGELLAYDRCPADSQGTSIVSICGVLFQ
jgi:AmmeMemoRadiSam system protein B